MEVRGGALCAKLDVLSDDCVGRYTSTVGLRNAAQLAGYSAPGDRLSTTASSVLLERHGLHLELLFDSTSVGGALDHPAGLIDVRIESALSTICDFEDSACTVDADDKVGAYRNWLGLMTRTLSVDVTKGGVTSVRTLKGPHYWRSPDGELGSVTLPGRALLLARNGMPAVGSIVHSWSTLDGAHSTKPRLRLSVG